MLAILNSLTSVITIHLHGGKSMGATGIMTLGHTHANNITHITTNGIVIIVLSVIV
jgi:hypothetical protein